jgi:DNA polymerase V
MEAAAQRGRGRPPGTGAFGEQTKPVRVPVSFVPVMRAWLAGRALSAKDMGATAADPEPVPLELPLSSVRASCGFPSPADDYIEETLDINKRLVRNPVATFYLTAEGDSMRGAGITEGDTLVIDRSVEPVNGSVVVATVDGDRTVKMLDIRKDGTVWLMPRNRRHQPIQITEDSNVRIWGVVTNVVKHLR